MVGIGLRIKKFNPTNRFSTCVLTSSEGPYPIDAAIMANPDGPQNYKWYIDMRNARLTTGQAIVWKNNTSAAWQKADGGLAPVLWVNNADNVYIASPTIGASVHITASDFSDRVRIDTNTGDAVWLWCGGRLRRVGVGAPNSAGNGYRVLVVSND
jgi:hypothetical protein